MRVGAPETCCNDGRLRGVEVEMVPNACSRGRDYPLAAFARDKTRRRSAPTRA